MLVSTKHRKLVLNLRDPDQVLTVIPTARRFEYKGRPLVAVPHQLEEVRVLRNLGFDTPAPMSAYYDWPGRYKPFAHQKITAEFLTTNPRAFCLNGMGCIAGDELVRVNRRGKSYETDLRTLHKKFHSLPDKSAWKARSLKGGEFGMNQLLDVLYKGEQETLRITLEDGKTFRATPDHQIARPDGSWTEAGALRVGDALVTNGQVSIACIKCGEFRLVKPGSVYKARVAPCKACRHRAHSEGMRGANNPAFRGGRFVDCDGYVRVRVPEHHRADGNGFVYEHIVVAEEAFGEQITRDFHVHHINGVKDDNRPENLEVMPARAHAGHHASRAHLDGSVSAKGGRVVVLPKQSQIASIEPGGVVDVYDLCMQGPHHNFVVNGVVVHNSGKTVSVLWAFDFLRREGLVKRMVVVSPLSTLERAWADEVFRHFPHLSCAVLHGTREKRHKLLAEDFDIYVINHDGIKNRETCLAIANREGMDLVVVDEIASFRNATTDRWKALNVLINGTRKGDVKPKDWAWGLTGTPTPNAPTDAWAQVRLINPGRAPQYFGHFRDSVMRQQTQFKWAPRDEAATVVAEAMKPSIRFAREDCIDLPPTTYVTRQTDLTDAQRRAFDEMVRKFKTENEQGQITAANEAVKLSKLLQICAGVAYGETGEVMMPATPRVNLVREIIDEADAKVLVFVPLTAPLLALAEELKKDYTVAVVHGETSKTQRDEIFKEFQQSPNPRVLLANPGTLSHGLTLTAANTIVWFVPIHSNETYQQANARVTRPGQTRNTLIVNVQATALEQKIYARLEGKQAMQGLLLDLLK